MKNEQIRSEGEQIIEEYFQEEDIKFKPEVKIENLKGDNKPYRKADFYLPQYKTYVEFFGLWNLDRNKEKYREKKRIYENNKIPCVYIYPDNLGILNFIFKRRLKNVLKKYNMRLELLKINWSILREKHLPPIIIFLLLVIFIENIVAKIIFGLFFIYFVYLGFKLTFFK